MKFLCKIFKHRWIKEEIEGFMFQGIRCKNCKLLLYPHSRDVGFGNSFRIVYRDVVSYTGEGNIVVYEKDVKE